MRCRRKDYADVEKIVRAKWRPRCEAIDNVREELTRENKKLREENDRLKERLSKQQDERIAQYELAKARHEEDRARHEERMKDLTMVYQRMQWLQAEVTRLSSSQSSTTGKPIFIALGFADC